MCPARLAPTGAFAMVRTLRGKVECVCDYRKITPYLVSVALFFFLGQSRIRTIHLRLPPINQVSGNHERAIVSAFTLRVQVTLPMRPALMFDIRELIYQTM